MCMNLANLPVYLCDIAVETFGVGGGERERTQERMREGLVWFGFVLFNDTWSQ